MVRNRPDIGLQVSFHCKLISVLYSGPNSNALMQMVQRRYSGSPKLIVEPFDTVETMRTTLLNDLNHTSGIMCGNYLGGVIFDKVDLASQELKYHILFPRRMEHKWQLTSFWTENGPYSTASDYNTIPGEPPYWSSGFLSVQFAIENAFLDVSFISY
jgi:hypothetical protein